MRTYVRFIWAISLLVILFISKSYAEKAAEGPISSEIGQHISELSRYLINKVTEEDVKELSEEDKYTVLLTILDCLEARHKYDIDDTIRERESLTKKKTGLEKNKASLEQELVGIDKGSLKGADPDLAKLNPTAWETRVKARKAEIDNEINKIKTNLQQTNKDIDKKENDIKKKAQAFQKEFGELEQKYQQIQKKKN